MESGREGGREAERGVQGRKWSLPIEVKEALVCFNKVTFQLSLVQSLVQSLYLVLLVT